MTNYQDSEFARTSVRPQGGAQGCAHDKTAGQPFCTAEGCPQGGVQGGAP